MNERLMSARKQKGVTQQDVATAAGITRQYYSLIEAGKRTPRIRVALRIAQALGSDLGSVFFSPQNDQSAAPDRAEGGR